MQRQHQSGAVSIEYALIAMLIAVAILGAVRNYAAITEVLYSIVETLVTAALGS